MKWFKKYKNIDLIQDYSLKNFRSKSFYKLDLYNEVPRWKPDYKYIIQQFKTYFKNILNINHENTEKNEK